MARDEESLNSRLSARSMGLARRQMPGGGEAFSGPLANQALQTLGARAMTMDQSVFVQEGFDASKPEDLALYAHEAHHQSESGGSDSHSEYDAEEQAARARERLVLHRAGAGHDPNDILGGLAGQNPMNSQQADDIFASSEQNGQQDGSGEPEPMQAYRNMLMDGMSHDQIVRFLAEGTVQALDHMEREEDARTAGQSRLS